VYPIEWSDNMGVNPQFIGPLNGDLHLASNSPMIDAADFLTSTKTSGRGKTIQIDDASYFHDGWGIIEGDVIQLEGQTVMARIVSINYDLNTILVDKDLSWNAGDGISLAYSGSAPDIGAYEYKSNGSSLNPPTALKIIK